MELQPWVLVRQAGQRIGTRHAIVAPQQQVLPGAIAQGPLRLQAQAQHIAQPVAGDDPGRQPVALRIERLQHEVAEHPALTGQPPARFAPYRIERLREGVFHLALQAMHQAGVATAGAAAMGHGDAAGEQRIQQVAAGGDGKTSLADPYVRHW